MTNRLVFGMASLFLLGATLGIVGCWSTETGQNFAQPKSNVDVVSTAQEIAKNVGTVQKTVSTGDKGPVFIFSEFHTSRVGQVQIAAMLLRLHDRYGMKTIGLEGKIYSTKPISAASFQKAGGGEAKADREDVGVRMVAEGEISSAEFMALEFPDIKVIGTESAEQYNQTLDVKGNPEVDYLLAIAEKSINEEDGRKVMQLIKARKEKQAYELLLTSDPWVKQQYESLESRQTTSSEEMVSHIQELESKADSVGARITPEAKGDAEKVKSFYRTASQRSDTMVGHALDLAAQSPTPIAMIIGAAHADKVCELLGQRGVSYALIQPIDLDPKTGTLTVAQFERKSNGGWAQNAKGTLGHVLNSQRKPPPVIERPSGESYASMQLAGMIVARAARAHKRLPDDISGQLATLPGIEIDKGSFETHGYDVIYRAWLTTDTGRKEVWARVGTAPPVAPKPLEEKLLDAQRLLKAGASGNGRGGGGGGSGRTIHAAGEDDGNRDGRGSDGNGNRSGHGDAVEEIPNSRRANNEGPGDAERGGVIISRTSRETLAAFGSSREEVRRVQQISY